MSVQTKVGSFQRALNAVESHSFQEKRIFVDIVQSRLNEKRRAEIVQDMEETKQAYRDGKTVVGNVKEILHHLLNNHV